MNGRIDTLEVGFDVPAGPAWPRPRSRRLLDALDALLRNVRKMGDYARAHGMRHRAHGKKPKSLDVLKLQQEWRRLACAARRSRKPKPSPGAQVRDPAKIDSPESPSGPVDVAVSRTSRPRWIPDAAMSGGRRRPLFMVAAAAMPCGLVLPSRWCGAAAGRSFRHR